ncbi:MAG: toxin-antitoxin system HicB family antitoxin [Dehalococcoidia bacterium]
MATMTAIRRSLDDYLALQYPFNVLADPDGGYVIVYPDLPGCMTQVEDVSEIAELAEDARRLWLETAYEQGLDVPLPSYPEEYSGKFNLRIPKSLHRTLAESAEAEGVSLNQYVTMLLARRDAEARAERRLETLRLEISSIRRVLGYQVREDSSVTATASRYSMNGDQILSVVAA